ncbi:NADPH-dependent oxidoreductase [Pseudoalteromonas citrea]|uniref:NADPH-dependent oxidoreductase n=1 Tax=Pseudoalteromonas citrea TaxID=43655 RepID=A0A5S3XQ19_9GAMM|nr:NAD(P)H-dependent oxidoreductase [Pseudoalteromonas citrea]TMP43866.1 NADPH-dependent oxidoreductase [Pseudoalteromonas citrea]TMP58574.1 NADPH-dependent oxidoreductase [Pseudoalteromonas citrea]
MNILIVSGSPRKGSQSAKVANQFKKILVQRLELDGKNVSILDLSDNKLPLWPADDPQLDAVQVKDNIESVVFQLQKADALVFLSPEYHGMASPALKNFFMYCPVLDIAHKPALAVGVSSGRGGTYPITELRISSFKNNHLFYIPEHLIISNVIEEFEKEDYSSWEEMSATEKRAADCLNMLITYADALKGVRGKLVDIQKDYPYGM